MVAPVAASVRPPAARKLRIAVLSTVYKATPPVGYGGIERVVHTLVEQLVRDGHHVTLFATAGSHCSGQTVAIKDYDPTVAPSGINSRGDIISEEKLYETVAAYLDQNTVDVIHDWSFENLYVRRHPERCPFVISTCIPPAPGYTRQQLVACSAAHAGQIGGTTRHVHYGLHLKDWNYRYDKTPELVHIAKIARYKGQHEALLAARKARRSLAIAGNVEDRLYYNAAIRPLLAVTPRSRYLGELRDTNAALLPAAALVQTPKWFDAFPLIVLESLASATPVIAYNVGGLGEQIVDGVTGFLCRDRHDLAEKMTQIDRIRQRDCRAYAEEHFSVARMARDYEALYWQAMDGERW